MVPTRHDDKHALHAALTQLAEQDPLINLRQDDVRDELYVSLYGEVQKEVIQATLAAEFGLEVEFAETTPIYIERLTGVGAAVETIGSPDNPFLATVGFRIEPASVDTFSHEVDVRSIPLYVFKTVDEFCESIEATVRTTLEQGLLGWQVTGWQVTLTDCGYASPSTTAADFRKLIPLVLMSALQAAGTEVCEPIHDFHLEGPGRRSSIGVPRPRAVACRSADVLDVGFVVHARRRDRGGSDAPPATAAPVADPWRGRARVRIRALPTGRGRSSDPIATRSQPAQPEGVSAARDATRTSRQ